MAQYNFEGDLSNISERQLEFLNKVILEQELDASKVVFYPVGKAGDNFVANIKRIHIEGANDSLKLVAKIAPTNEMARQTTNTGILFNNEHTMYTEVLPKFVSLQKAAGVPEEEQLRFAKCYGSLTEQPNEVIVLEDLNESGFIMMNKFESLSNECVRSILRNFAILHSLSYALKNKEPQKYDELKGKLMDAWELMAAIPQFAMHIANLESEIISVMEDEEHKRILKNKITDLFKVRAKLMKHENEKYMVIQQGDAWTNNVMFKLEEGSVESIMIDYQASSNVSPVVDLLYMIFNCTDHETRSKHFYDWIDYYHSELDNSLSNFGLKANFIYPRDQLDADLKRYAKLLFGLSLILANVLMRDSQEAGLVLEAMRNSGVNELLESMTNQSLQGETVVRIQKRVGGLIATFNEFGLL
uniref:CHK kinase-like domain-containing protein n=1 Tax=Heliothis virescens TaxID=7102 RepID=A0A2A4JDG0_HELVI